MYTKPNKRFNTRLIKTTLFLLLFMFGVTSSLYFPNKAYADTLNTEDLAGKYQAFRFLKECSSQGFSNGHSFFSNYNGGLSIDEINSGDFMDEGDQVSRQIGNHGQISTGYLIKGNDKGAMRCDNKNHIKNALSQLGVTGKQLVIDTDIYKLKQSNGRYYVDPKKLPDYPKKIEKVILDKYSKFKDPNYIKIVQYFNLAESLKNNHGCSAKENEGGIDVRMIKSPGEDAVDVKYLPKDGLDAEARVGIGMPGDGGGGDGVMKCSTVINQMNILADDVAKILKDLIDHDTDIDTGNYSSGDDPDAGAPACETSGFNLSWIMCPIITGFAETSDTIFNQMVQPLLVSRDLGYTDPNRGAVSSNAADEDQKNLFQIWSTFRILANILLVVALLIIVIGQSIGGGMIDAYTVKKTLPRLVLAAVLVNISIYLVVIALDVTNIVGSGINSLLLAPLRGTDQAIVRLSVGGQGMITLTAGLGLLGVIVAAGSMGGLLVLFLLVALILVLAVLAVLMTLVVRQGIIIFLVLTSPVAFVLYALPNTEQYFKKWWSLLFKTLLVYPIVMIILSMSYMMSILLSGTFPQGVQWVADVVSILLMIIPLFLIPFAFKFAGGMTGTLFNALSNNPLSKLAKQGVAKQAAKGAKMSAMKAKTGHFAKGSRFIPGSNRIAGMINRGTRGVGAGFKTGAKRAAYYDTLEMGNAEGIMQSEQFKGIQFNNDAMHALTYNSEQEAYENLRQRFMRDDPNLSEDDANRRARDAAKIASLVGRFGGAYSVAAARQLAINKDGYANSAEAMDIVNRVASNNSSLRKSLMENVKFTSKQVSRSDLGALGDMNEEEQALYNSGDVEGARALWSDRMTLEGLETADDASLARMHKMGMKNAEDAITRHHGSGSSLSGKATTAATDLTKAGLYATRGNREHINPLGRLETGETFTPKSSDTTETLQDPNDPGKLITRPVSEQPRNETIIDVALRQPGTQNPNDPNNQPPAGEGGAGAGP